MKLSSTAMDGIKITALTFLLMPPQVISQSPPSPGPPYLQSIVIIIVVVIAALLIVRILSVYICQGSEFIHVVGRNTNSVTRRSWNAAARGLDPAVIEHLPTFPYLQVKELKIGKGALECVVCLMEFKEGEMLRLIPKCDHVFHPDCIDNWLATHTTCPVCRSNLVPELSDSAVKHTESTSESDVEAQNNMVVDEHEGALRPPEPEVMINANETFNRNRTRGSISFGRLPKSPRNGHSLVQPGQDMERFTLRLPAKARKQLMNRQLNRATSLLVFSTEGSSRRRYITGNSRGKSFGRLERLDWTKSYRWRWASSFISPRGIANDSVGSSRLSESSRWVYVAQPDCL